MLAIKTSRDLLEVFPCLVRSECEIRIAIPITIAQQTACSRAAYLLISCVQVKRAFRTLKTLGVHLSSGDKLAARLQTSPATTLSAQPPKHHWKHRTKPSPHMSTIKNEILPQMLTAPPSHDPCLCMSLHIPSMRQFHSNTYKEVRRRLAACKWMYAWQQQEHRQCGLGARQCSRRPPGAVCLLHCWWEP